jgi:site-specific DNA recombinase
MTRTAFYARYSSDLQSPASIEDQLRMCREYAAAHDIPVDDQYVFVDAAICGAAMSNRPGLQALLAAAERKPRPIDTLLIDDSSRLSRDQADSFTICKRLEFAGVRLVCVSQGIDSDNEQAHVLMTVHGMVDSLYVRELGKKTWRGMEGKVKGGFSAGGRTFGYDNVQTPDGVRQQINPAQAATVLRIFELAAEGRSLKGIAKTLNAESIAPPRPRAGRRPAWCHNAIRAMLRNPIYIGKVIWNRDRFIRTPAGKRVARPRPESEWRRLDAPELRIIDDDLWERVQRTLAWKREHYGRGGGMYGRVSNHLLTGFLRCAECGGPLTIVAGYHKARTSRYGCSNHANRGDSVCKNDLRESEEQIQQRLLSKLQDAVLSKEAVEFAIEEFGRQLQAQLSSVSSKLDADRERKAVLEAELGRLWAVVASGSEFQSLRAQIAQRDAELREITDRTLSPGPGSVEADLAEIRTFVTKSLRDLPGLLNQDTSAARAWLAQHVSKITMTPTQGIDGKRFYRASGEWDLLGATERQIGVIAGGGFEPPTFGL